MTDRGVLRGGAQFEDARSAALEKSILCGNALRLGGAAELRRHALYPGNKIREILRNERLLEPFRHERDRQWMPFDNVSSRHRFNHPTG
jgi:hypothetical protein